LPYSYIIVTDILVNVNILDLHTFCTLHRYVSRHKLCFIAVSGGQQRLISKLDHLILMHNGCLCTYIW